MHDGLAKWNAYINTARCRFQKKKKSKFECVTCLIGYADISSATDSRKENNAAYAHIH